jgi:hypothetical protein
MNSTPPLSGRTLLRPLSPSLPPAGPGERGESKTRRRELAGFFKTNRSLFSRRTGGRLGEEGWGDEGPAARTD